MLRLRDQQLSLWQEALPPGVLKLSEELALVDEILEDERFFDLYLEHFNTRIGRPTVPVATYLRMMYLKFRFDLGYESLVKEVNDSFQWRRFCQLGFREAPDATTLIKLTKKYGERSIKQLNRLLLKKARERRVVRGRKLRLDTTVVEADIHYPTDAQLLADGMRVITRSVVRLKKAGAAAGTRFRSFKRKVQGRLMELNKGLRQGKEAARQLRQRATEELLSMAEEVVARGERVLHNASRWVKRQKGEVSKAIKGEIAQLNRMVRVLRKVTHQTMMVLAGEKHLAERVVSVFDPEARPICKGKLAKPTEFGYTVLLQGVEGGFISGYQVFKGNPTDTSMVKTALKGHRSIFKKAPRSVAGDRGFYSKHNESWLQNERVKQVSLPVRGKKTRERQAYEKERWFRRLQRFRAGMEAKVSLLKRRFGLRRSRLKGREGTQKWVGWSVLTHNLWNMARMAS